MHNEVRPPLLTYKILVTHFEAGTHFVRVFLDDAGVEDDYQLPPNSIAAYFDTSINQWRVNFGEFEWLDKPEEFGMDYKEVALQ